MRRVSEPEIVFEVRGRLGLITLNRPTALNALTFGMVRELDAQLQRWANDPAIAAVAIRGAGDRAFCAGGDIRAIYDLAQAGRASEAVAFWRTEYALNTLIHEYPKPYVALIHGIVMGGGVGVSILGSHRVVAEKVTFAMPEVGIGFYPDVGATYFLPRLPGRSGRWLALTGARIGAADCLALGLATHHVPAAKFDNVIAALAEGGRVETVLAWHGIEADTASVTASRMAIDRLFAGASIDEILAALDAETGAAADFAHAAAAAIRTKSPTSLKIALEQMKRGGGLDFREAMRVEFRLASRILDRPDMVEGVRAVVVDKDNAPRWQPATLADVSDAAVEAMFAPLGDRELMFA